MDLLIVVVLVWMLGEFCKYYYKEVEVWFVGEIVKDLIGYIVL